MTYTSRQYAEALYDVLLGKSIKTRSNILMRFQQILHKNHQTKLLNNILVQYEKVFLARENLRKVDVESASPLSAEVKKKIESRFDNKLLLTESVNENLIAGLTITIDDSLFIDASAKTFIHNLFR
jgi:F0F1-type ATP synthase delta subunit